jgi:uncharacterized protein (TIGR03435 family)
MWKTGTMMLIAIPFALAQRPEFEVASVKLNKDGAPIGETPKRSGDRFTMINTELYWMITYAYHLEGAFELIADRKGPLWTDDYYDVQAKAPAGATEEQVRLMMQSLLEDRFKLKAHRETRESAMYRLVIAKGGMKLHPETFELKTQINGRAVPARPGTCRTLVGKEGFHLIGVGTTMDQLRRELELALAAPVADDTGIEGKHTFEMLYAMPTWVGIHTYDDVTPPPPLTQAVESDLGLRLEKGKGRIEVLVIDHVEKASAN